jgi:hypothetical protein
LSREEAIAIVLGVAPSFHLHLESVVERLAFESKSVARLVKGDAAGELYLPCTPNELVKWSVRTGVTLPRDFVANVRAKKRSTSSTAPTKSTRVRSSRLIEGGIDPEIQAKANEVAAQLRANRTKKQKVHKNDIAIVLEPLYPDLDCGSIMRRFHLPRA